MLRDAYVLGPRLGAGGMGEVFAATRTADERRVAIKLLTRQDPDNAETFARFRREAEIARRLMHPNIVEVLDFNQGHDGTPFLVMELLEGEDLAARIERGPLPLADALRIAAELTSALGAAHAAGVVHRDLKPQNVFLVRGAGGEERVKVLDFGISKIAGDNDFTRSQVLIGTPSYMAPEQARGRAKLVDGRADQFALGTLLYEMLTGTCPFGGDSIPGVLYQVVHHHPPPLHRERPELPRHVTRAVARAMAKDPGARFADVGALAAALRGELTLDDTLDTRPVRIVLGPRAVADSAATIVLAGGPAAPRVAAAQTPAPAPLPSLADEVEPVRRRWGLYLVLATITAAGCAGAFAIARGAPPRRVAPAPRVIVPDGPPMITVVLSSSPPADEVWVDGHPASAGELRLPADGASHLFVFRKAGFPDVVRNQVAVTSGTIEVTFVPAPPTPPKRPRGRATTRGPVATSAAVR